MKDFENIVYFAMGFVLGAFLIGFILLATKTRPIDM